MSDQLELFNKTEEKLPDIKPADLFYARCNECNEPFALCDSCGEVFENGDRYYCDGNKAGYKNHYCKECNKKMGKGD